MLDGLNLDPNVMIQVQNNTIAQQAVRIVGLEAAVQQLAQEKAAAEAQIPEVTEVKEDASADG